MNLKLEIEDLLKAIVCKEKTTETSCTSGKLLHTLFRAGTSKIIYTSADQELLGPLVLKSLPALSHRVFILENNFASNSIDTTRIERSGLQFLLDDFKSFPTDPANPIRSLEKYFQDFIAEEDIEGLDERLKNCVDDFYVDDPVRSYTLQEHISRLPESHWWFKV